MRKYDAYYCHNIFKGDEKVFLVLRNWPKNQSDESQIYCIMAQNEKPRTFILREAWMCLPNFMTSSLQLVRLFAQNHNGYENLGAMKVCGQVMGY